MSVKALVMLALVGCAESAPEEFQIPEHQTVYACTRGPEVVGEWCFDGTAEELGALVRARCGPSEDERFCVGPLGQCYPVCLHCCGPDCGPGSNALNGSWCAS